MQNNKLNPWTCGKEPVIDKDILASKEDENDQTQVQKLIDKYERKLKTTKLYYMEKMK